MVRIGVVIVKREQSEDYQGLVRLSQVRRSCCELANRSLVTIDDLSNEEIELLFLLADEMGESVDKQVGLCQGKIMASLFF